MGMNPDPDMVDVEDLNDGVRQLEALVDADGVRTTGEQRVVALFSIAVSRLTRRVRARGAMETIFSAELNGSAPSRYVRTKAEDAGITVVVATDGRVLDIVAGGLGCESDLDPVAA